MRSRCIAFLKTRTVSSALLVVCSVLPARAAAEAVALENALLRYEVTGDGRNAALTDKASGANLLARGGGSPVCTLQKGGATFESTSLSAHDDLWRISFGESGVELLLRVQTHDTHFTFEVQSLSGEGTDQLNFLYLPLGEQARSGPAACTVLALNLQTNVPELPGPMAAPLATCYPRFGFAGARAALIVAPRDGLRETLRHVIEAEGLSHSTLGGPWALDAEINRGSYLIDTEGELGEATVDDWIALAKNLGMKQIDFHTGKSMRFGDLQPNPERYPNGLDGVKAMVDKLHAAGLAAGLHTYAFFVARDTPWVTPIPDRRLATSATFTLDTAVDDSADTLPVLESTAGVSTVTGFQIRNSVTLRVDDELIVFSGVTSETPFVFTGCQRGAWGTVAAAHHRGAKVLQLKECFGLFTPDGDSTLFADVAARTAEVYNRCGFDMIYLDALDGSDILAGGPWSWYYAAKFVDELNARLERPALFEMSTMTHHLWRFRSRMGAWDVPVRGAQRLADIHALANEDAARVYMPANLGWSGIFDWNAVQPERTFAADVEHLCARALAADHSLSLLVGFTPASWERSENVRRLGAIIQRYETLRMGRVLPPGIRSRLQQHDGSFTVEPADAESWLARPVRQATHRVERPESNTWRVDNPYEPQQPRIRLETLAGLEPYGSDDAPLLVQGSETAEFQSAEAAPGVSLRWETGPVAPGASETALTLVAANDGAASRTSYCGARKRFDPPLNLYGRGLGLWVHGDGKGAVLNVQLQSTEAAAGGRADHYVDLDFEGWRYVELVEAESDRLGELGWPYSRRHADWKEGEVPFGEVLKDFILWINFVQVEFLTLWLNNIPAGASVRCLVGPIRALPVRQLTLDHPALHWNGNTLSIPVSIRSGDYVELDNKGAGGLYGPQGELLQGLSLATLPELSSGSTPIMLTSGVTTFARARVAVTVTGPPFTE